MKKLFTFLLSAILVSCVSVHSYAQIITTIAGTDTSGYNGDGISAVAAELNQPGNVAVDPIGNIYIADTRNNRIRKINSSGMISTFAGTGVAGYNGDDIPATNAQLNVPIKVASDDLGNIYIADGHNNRIRKISSSGLITTIAGTGIAGFNGDGIAATNAQLNIPGSMVVDAVGNVFVADALNNRIRKISPIGIITSIAGTGEIGFFGDGGQATSAKLWSPIDIAIDQDGTIYFIDYLNVRIRKIDASGNIHTVAGSGTVGNTGNGGSATTANLDGPFGIAVDSNSNFYIAEAYNHIVRQVNSAGIISVFAGDGSSGYSGDNGPALLAKFVNPNGVSFDKTGNIYITDYGTGTVRYIRNTVKVITVNDESTGILAYPNPCSGAFIVGVKSSTEDMAHIIITDIAGNCVKDIQEKTDKPINLKLDERSGVYLISVTTGSNLISSKIVIER